MSALPAAEPTPQEIVARESDGRRRAGLAALGAGLLTLGAGVGLILVSADRPYVTMLETLQGAVTQPDRSLRAPLLEFLDERALGLNAISVGQGAGLLLTIVVLLFLADATEARGAPMRTGRVFALLGIAGGLGVIALQVLTSIRVGDFVSDGVFTQAAEDDIGEGGLLLALQLLGDLGRLALSVAVVFISLSAMRVGLLSRFLGILGIIAGVIPLLGGILGGGLTGPLPIVQTFWLGALGVMLLGYGSVPPAWEAGEARPWPTQQELREQRERARGGPAAGEDDDSVPRPRTDEPSPATSARKRKKRRG